MSTLVLLGVIFVLFLIAIVAVLYIMKFRRNWSTENRQAQIDYEIGRAIDRGDHAEVQRLRDEKVELMLYG